jgi:hypothetical protein
MKAASEWRVSRSTLPEVVQGELALVGDEDVAGMRIAVEEAEHEELVQVGVDQDLRQVGALAARGDELDALAEDALLDHHGLGAELRDHVGDEHRGPAVEGRGETVRVARLLAQVELAAQVGPHLAHHGLGAIAREHRGEVRQEPHDEDQDAHVAVDLQLHARAQHLHDDLASVEGARRMHLRHGRGGEGLRVEADEEELRRLAERFLDRGDRLLDREGLHVVLQLLQLGEVFGREEIGAQAQGLAQLHEGRAQILQ